MYPRRFGRWRRRFDDDIESIIANERYVFISSIMKTCMETCGMAKNQKEKRTVSDRIDQFVTNRWLALPFFAAMFFDLLLRPSKTGAILRRGTDRMAGANS